MLYGNFKNISHAKIYKDTESCHTRSFLNPLFIFFRSIISPLSSRCSIFAFFHFLIFPLFHVSNNPLFHFFQYSNIPLFLVPSFLFSFLFSSIISLFCLFHHFITPSFHSSTIPSFLFSISPIIPPFHDSIIPLFLEDRQHDFKGGSPSFFTLHFDPSLVGFDNHLAVEKTNAHASLFCGFERVKEGFFHEFF